MSEEKALMEYRIGKMEETQSNIVKTVNEMDNKINEQVTAFEILKTKVTMYVSILAVVLSIGVNVATKYVNTQISAYSSPDKTVSNVVDRSKEVEELKATIERLEQELRKED